MSSKLQQFSESELLYLFEKQGESSYLGEALSRYTLRLLGVSMKYLKDEDEAKDMVQQVFMKALGEFGKYKVDNFGGWLYRIAQNACISKLRQKDQTVGEDQLRYKAHEPEEEEAQLWEKEATIDRMKAAMEDLKPAHRQCLEKFYFEQKSYQQIAEETGFDLAAVKSYIQNGKRNLRNLMEQSK